MTTVTGPPRSSGAVAPGSVVVVRDEEWLVTSAEETGDGLLVRVQGLTELVRDTTATFYEALDTIEVLDPADAVVVADTSPRHRTSRLWLEATVRKTPVPLYAPSLTVSTEGLADALSYQQSAVRKALDPDNLRPRILLADAVGLGKTLEIGMILSELVRRGRGERVLVVTPRHVLEQMQHELWSRFALPFVRLDSTGIQRVRQKLPATRNPFTFYKRAIISIDTLKSDRYLHSLAKQRWDAVVIDESHNITNTATQNNRLARTLANTTEALILASATPHNGKRESFAELVRLLEPSAVTPSGEIKKTELERLVVRRHRHSQEVASVVGADWAERQEPHFFSALANAQEDAVADELVATWLHPRDGAVPTTGKSAALFPWTLAKAYLSSPAALAQTISERLKRVPDDASGDAERAALTRLADLTGSVHGSAKYDALLEHLRGVGVGPSSSERVVVFAERVATLTWLAARLQRDLRLAADAVAVMHGGLTDEEQQRTVDRFKQASSPLRVLVTGDVASEGVNLHAQCHELVHYDIPWSLIRIEQRNGRIDRYGQKKPPRITTLLLIPSDAQFAGDVRVLKRLMDKEHEAHSALGDVASLMGQYSVDSEEQLLRQVLAGKTSLDDVVRSPAQVVDGDDLEALLLSLGVSAEPGEDSGQVSVGEASSTDTPLHTTGLFADEVSYLEEALRSAYQEAGPAAPVEKKGVAWDRQEGHGTAQLVPPPDLRQRLDVLPQSYLSERGVTQKLVLATTRARGKAELHSALADATSSSWPEAHYLSPLHPVLDWAADRALAALGRNEVFAVRGPVDAPQVLLLGTLTNRRGHVVAASWLTVAFPNGTPEFALPTQHETVADALEHLGVSGSRANPGAVPDLEALTALIAPAVRSARGSMGAAFAAAEADVTQRVNAWTARLTDWQEQAALLPRSEVLRERRAPVEREQELVASMRPDRQLVRPLLVVVPESRR